ncbi:DUF1501 domain-containing protein [Variovorax sp. OV329]|uniref:DUF1501 domain-containing protein n=1 Tax=Variovorax sp. OV329 TaxID=1882825 RepID=UPI0008EA62BE|nr:DUF1501 domain-containing protein [Variovorax sp. OV329]SFM44315.1 Uncharacterized conserved protein, DUF1501 family [Variovorax sp. OV329]
MIRSRRDFLATTAVVGAGPWLWGPALALARVESDRRFVFVIQRGAADGLNTLIPYADPDYARLRGPLALAPEAASRLDGTFALHPSMVEASKLYAAGQALLVHAVASPYRDRSHFDGQNVLETGGVSPYRLKAGWLNRLLPLLPGGADKAIALAPTVPMALRGPVEVGSYAPSTLPQPSDDLLARVSDLYRGDAQLHALWAAAMENRAMAGQAGQRQDATALGKLAASFLAKPDGPRIAMIETGGWDTHSAQNPRLAAQLRSLDALVASLRDGLGEAWRTTTVLVATEFGRTAAANGTGGTDHGTGAVAMLFGGAVQGGRVLADWPGLGPSSLHEGRDLRPTQDLYAIMATSAGEAFGVDPQKLARAVFPEARVSSFPSGLVHA